ncbi:MAG: alpha/beta hydrolase fold protein [Myxococcales bacterium]|nr:alpha/beta hydrolase fold protein [Myxococcales bacterium]
MSEPPGPIAPTSETTIDVRGAGLYAETFLPKETPRGVVLITHGYAEHCGRYREVAHVIVNAGWAALAYDVRGHGQSPGERGFIDHFETYVDDFTAALAAARKLVPPNAPTVLLGHSHGSLITLRALCGDHPPQVAAAVLASPFLGLRLAVPRHKKLLAKVASRLAPKFAQANQLRVEDLTHDKAKQAERLADKLCFDVATARWFTESMAAQDYVAQHAERIKVPTTWLVGGADSIADPGQSRRVAGRISGAQYHDLAGLNHEVFNEVDRVKVFGELAKVLTACKAATA